MELAKHDNMILVLLWKSPDWRKCFHAYSEIKGVYRVFLTNLSHYISEDLIEIILLRMEQNISLAFDNLGSKQGRHPMKCFCHGSFQLLSKVL